MVLSARSGKSHWSAAVPTLWLLLRFNRRVVFMSLEGGAQVWLEALEGVGKALCSRTEARLYFGQAQRGR